MVIGFNVLKYQLVIVIGFNVLKYLLLPWREAAFVDTKHDGLPRLNSGQKRRSM